MHVSYIYDITVFYIINVQKLNPNQLEAVSMQDINSEGPITNNVQLKTIKD